MVGGTVDLDGADAVGDFINIDAPLTINAATMSNFGNVNGGGGINTLDVNNSVGTGVLTVNLDNPDGRMDAQRPRRDEPGQRQRRCDAARRQRRQRQRHGQCHRRRADDGSPRHRLGNRQHQHGRPAAAAGGRQRHERSQYARRRHDQRRRACLGADTGKALHGFGTINADIDFDGTANLRADNGTLTINGIIIDVSVLGTADADGVLNIPAAWNT